MSTLLQDMLQVAIPLHIQELRKQGGPSDEEWDAATAFGQALAEKGDRLLFGSIVPGETADLFNKMARSAAVLAFLPGGIILFNNHWEANRGVPAPKSDSPAPPTRTPEHQSSLDELFSDSTKDINSAILRERQGLEENAK